MKYEIYEKLYVQFISSLSGSVPGGTNPVKSLAENLALSRKFMAELRQLVLDVPFTSQATEIHFFKHIKPKFYAEKIFAFEVYNVEMNKPVGTIDMIRSFLEDELRLIHRFFQQYAFLYQYYRSNAVELDSLYFVRGADIPLAMVPEMPDPDPEFSTAMDYLFAKFIAFEKLQNYLVEALRTPLPFMHESPVKRKSRRELRWTGDAINAVELGFSLHDTGQLNDGKASLVEIFEWMEEHLHISIKKPHRRFDEIESRKIISKTDFTDRLRDAILNRIDRKNEYDPDKEEARRLRAEKRKKLSEKKATEKKTADDAKNKSS
ncbi:RteC domain-containing protein [Pedobacter nyackensis]|uniref:RteC protein n=1 Tax=Pedobacter nyackensis TaxID=475255 RepID=A0A1W2DWA0_9SPHI|nr:RteC domain-containing protein [Pedobacter nyackensis]SMD01362.1 RteC protein [Pedobacter nyackensis]